MIQPVVYTDEGWTFKILQLHLRDILNKRMPPDTYERGKSGFKYSQSYRENFGSKLWP